MRVVHVWATCVHLCVVVCSSHSELLLPSHPRVFRSQRAWYGVVLGAVPADVTH